MEKASKHFTLDSEYFEMYKSVIQKYKITELYIE